MKINWIEDSAGVAIVTAKGIPITDIEISVSQIDRKASAENRARLNPLDRDRLDGIHRSYIAGIPIPKIIVRKKGSRYVIAGGNHRFNSLPDGVTRISVHCIECIDAEFERICRQLNTVVGEGMTKHERIDAAVDAVERLGDSIKLAAEDYGISVSVLAAAIKQEHTLKRLEIINPRCKQYLTSTHTTAIGELAQNTNVLRAIATYIVDAKPTTKELKEITKKARGQSSEAAQIKLFEDATATSVALKSRKVPRKKRQQFLAGLGALDAVLKTGATWNNLELTEEELGSVRIQVVRIKNLLISLLEEGGPL